MNSLARHALQQPSTDAEGFRQALRNFGEIIRAAGPEILEEASVEVYGSIVHGSPLSGAPGQPVLSGTLRDSWEVKNEPGGRISVTTDSPYGRVVEHNFRRVTKAQKKEIRAVLKEKAGRESFRKFGLLKSRIPRLTKALLNRFRKTQPGLTFHNGGPHSVALTQLAWPRIAQAVATRFGWGDLNG